MREAAAPPEDKAADAGNEDIEEKEETKGKLGARDEIAVLMQGKCDLLYVQGKIAGEDVNLLVDTGATANFAPRVLIQALQLPVMDT